MYKQPWSEAKVPTRFWSKVDKSGSCWIWTSAKDKDGYGLFRFPWGTARAHRVAYEFLVGPIPDGLVIDHLCRNRGCVHPDHLEPVTNVENIRRGEVKPPTVPPLKSHCKHGHPFDETNTQMRGNVRLCRECLRRRSRDHWRRKFGLGIIEVV